MFSVFESAELDLRFEASICLSKACFFPFSHVYVHICMYMYLYIAYIYRRKLYVAESIEEILVIWGNSFIKALFPYLQAVTGTLQFMLLL